MKSHQILFSGPMVNAIIAGHKTVTRRLVSARRSGLVPGDELWVKETFALDGERVVYRAGAVERWRWTPSIYMPRRLSRLALQVISVRLEPLHAITEDDVLLEGIAGTEQLPPGECSRVNAFAALWECLNGPGSWLRNPDVFRIEFAVKR